MAKIVKCVRKDNKHQRKIIDLALEYAKELDPLSSGKIPCHHKERLGELIKELCGNSSCKDCKLCFWEGKKKSYAPLKDVVIAYGCGWKRVPSKTDSWDDCWEKARVKLQEYFFFTLMELEIWFSKKWPAYKEAWLSNSEKDLKDRELILPALKIKNDAIFLYAIFVTEDKIFSGREMVVDYQKEQNKTEVLIYMESTQNGKSQRELPISTIPQDDIRHFLIKKPIEVFSRKSVSIEKFPVNSNLKVTFFNNQPMMYIEPPHTKGRPGRSKGTKEYRLDPSHSIKISVAQGKSLEISQLKCNCGHYDCNQRHKLASWSPRARKSRYKWLSLSRYIHEAVQGTRVIEDISQPNKKKTQHKKTSSKQKDNKNNGLSHSLAGSMWFQMRQNYPLDDKVKIVDSNWYDDNNSKGYRSFKIFNQNQQHLEHHFYWNCTKCKPKGSKMSKCNNHDNCKKRGNKQSCEKVFPVPEIEELYEVLCEDGHSNNFLLFLIEHYNDLLPMWGKNLKLSKRLFNRNPIDYYFKAIVRLMMVIDCSSNIFSLDQEVFEKFKANFPQYKLSDKTTIRKTLKSYLNEAAQIPWLPSDLTKEQCAAEVRHKIFRELPPDRQRFLLQCHDGKCLLKISEDNLKDSISQRVTRLSVLVKGI